MCAEVRAEVHTKPMSLISPRSPIKRGEISDCAPRYSPQVHFHGARDLHGSSAREVQILIKMLEGSLLHQYFHR